VSAHQARYAIRCEWGAQGLDQFRSECDVLIVIDVLSFSTAVDVGVSRGARIYPYPWKDGTDEDFVHDNRAAVAASIRKARAGVYSLSPTSLLEAPASLRLVLPSPNGGSLCYAARGESVFTACLRNARAVAAAAVERGATFGVIPAGERWIGGALRPALEDLLGAGAVIRHLPGTRSPEAELAARAFAAYTHDLRDALMGCVSGQELRERGHLEDLLLAADLDVSTTAPQLLEGAFERARQL